MTKTDHPPRTYARSLVSAGNLAIGQFFQRVRMLCGHEKIGTFAELIGLKDGAHLGRIESGKRPPGNDVMDKLYPFIVQAGLEPRDLILLWLQFQGLEKYVHDLKQPKKKRTKH